MEALSARLQWGSIPFNRIADQEARYRELVDGSFADWIRERDQEDVKLYAAIQAPCG